MEHDTQDRIRRTLRLLLAARDLTAGQLAEALGMNKQQMSNRITGRTHWTIDMLEDVARELRVRPAVWFDAPENALNHLIEATEAGPETEARKSRFSAALAQMGELVSPKHMTREMAHSGVL